MDKDLSHSNLPLVLLDLRLFQTSLWNGQKVFTSLNRWEANEKFCDNLINRLCTSKNKSILKPCIQLSPILDYQKNVSDHQNLHLKEVQRIFIFQKYLKNIQLVL
jgi:hypothetical protein